MNLTLLLARLVHVGGGVFWAGSMIFVAAYLFPAIRDAGPDGAKVAAGLAKRGFMTVVPIVAVLTLLSGFYLYWHASVGFGKGYGGSAPGMAYGVGALAALIAFGLGVGIVRPSMLKAGALSASAAGAEASAREAMAAQAQALRARAGSMGQVVAWLLAAAALAMAVARYL
jgi:uncharacterized membrane protein